MTYQKFDPGRLRTDRNGAPSPLTSEAPSANFSDFSSFSSPSRHDLRDALDALRPFLVPQLAALNDTRLLVLVRHAVQTARDHTGGPGYRYCSGCGLRLSVVAVSDQCGFCGRMYAR